MKQLFFFTIINSFLICSSLFLYWSSIIYDNYLYLYFLYLSKTYALLTMTKYSQKNKAYITPREENYEICSILNVFSSIFIETSTHVIAPYFIEFTDRKIIYDLLLFVPISFIFEVIYDFMHYWIHRLFHYNKLLYKYIHKKHHIKTNTTYLDTYYQNPIDVILSNSIPFCLTLYILGNVSYFQFILLVVYKTAVEIAGHTGKKTFPTSSFPQFPWLVKYLGIELYTEDHDLHHRYTNCNFSKRLSFWDKIFGTYKNE